MAEAAGTGEAQDAAVETSPNGPDRPLGIPLEYVWDPELGPVDEATGQPTGAWKEPD